MEHPSIRVECLLVTKGMWDHTQTTSEIDASGDAKARAAIGMHLAEQHLETFMECRTCGKQTQAFRAFIQASNFYS